jgi:uncharacterized membrane protein
MGAVIFSIWFPANKQAEQRKPVDDTSTILKNKYAKGEITK